MTRYLLRAGARVTAVEKDDRLIDLLQGAFEAVSSTASLSCGMPALQQSRLHPLSPVVQEPLRVVHADVLQLDKDELLQSMAIAAEGNPQ